MTLFYKPAKMIIGLLLIPACVGATLALRQIIIAGGFTGVMWLWVIVGVLFWFALYLILPRPAFIYVCGHELTHALWTWIFGGKIEQIKVTGEGGHVLATKANFFTVLAPYFFPFYAALVLAVFALGNFFWNWSGYGFLFYALFGAAYGFHFSLTAHALKTKQPDIVGQGYLFSGAIIFLCNMAPLLIGAALLSDKVNVSSAVGWWFQFTAETFHQIGRLF